MSDLRSPFRGGRLDRADAERLAGVLKAIADPARLQLLGLLSEGEATCGELIAGIGRLSQATVSHHLRILAAAGLIERRKEGVYVRHTLVRAGIGAVAEALRPGRAR